MSSPAHSQIRHELPLPFVQGWGAHGIGDCPAAGGSTLKKLTRNQAIDIALSLHNQPLEGHAREKASLPLFTREKPPVSLHIHIALHRWLVKIRGTSQIICPQWFQCLTAKSILHVKSSRQHCLLFSHHGEPASKQLSEPSLSDCWLNHPQYLWTISSHRRLALRPSRRHSGRASKSAR